MVNNVIIGATSAIAEHCARLWVKNASIGLVLVGRDIQLLERVASDLRVRGPQCKITVMQADFENPTAIQTAVSDIVQLGEIGTVLIAHGSLPDQAACQGDVKACHSALHVNAISPVLYAECFAAHMEKVGCGTIVLIGSVAGDRGRKSNYIYGAAKGLITRYAQGLQHRFAKSNVKITLVKPGPTATPMTAHLQNKGVKMATVESVASEIVSGVGAGKLIIYTPKKWWLIMMIIRHLPQWIFNRMDI